MSKEKRPKTPPPKKKKKKKGWVSTVILVFILFLGAGIMAYPTFSDWWNSFHQSRAIAFYANVVENTDPELMERMLAEAEAYNARLLQKPNRYVMDEEEQVEYNALLDLTGNGIMGYIYIEKIGVYLPVYHGTNEKVLQIAVGHIEGSSLPVGGASTHSVLSGHRGLPSAKLFSDLDKVEEGDIFTLTILDEVINYEVDQIRIVEPTDVSDLNIVSGQDYCTLVTCTPYGINTHRMLVRGHRVELGEEETVVVLAGAIRIPNYIVIPAVGIPLLFLFLLIMLVYYRGRRPQYTEDELISKYIEQQSENERILIGRVPASTGPDAEAEGSPPEDVEAEPAEETPEEPEPEEPEPEGPAEETPEEPKPEEPEPEGSAEETPTEAEEEQTDPDEPKKNGKKKKKKGKANRRKSARTKRKDK